MGSNDSCLPDELYDLAKILTDDLDKPVIPPTRSLNSCEGDQNGDRIEFSFGHVFTLKEFTSIGVGDLLKCQPKSLSHDHILWSYRTICKRVETDAYEFSLMSIGSHINQRTDPDFNAPLALKEPEIAASMAILGEKGNEVMKMTLTQSLVVPKRFSMRELIGLSVTNKIPLVIRIAVDRSYFSLANIIDLDELPTVSLERQATIDQILRGEKPVGCFWKVTVPQEQNGQGDTSGHKSFYIHKAAITKAIPALKNFPGFDSGHRFITDFINVKGTDSFEMPTLTAVDMKVIIPLIYDAPVPLPERWEKISILVGTIRVLFSAKIVIDLAAQWEKAICNAALALDVGRTVTSDVSGLPAIARLLAIVWAFPYGSMPVAKRVAVGVMADIVHRNTDGDIAEHLRVIPEVVASLLEGQVTAISSVIMHLNHVARVHKTFLAASESAATAAAPIPATPTAAAILDASIESAAARDVAIDVSGVDEEWYDAETIDNRKKEASKWGCAIC